MVIGRFFQQHGGKWVIKWVCNNCDHVELENKEYVKPKISMDRQKKCPKCKSFGKDDYIKAARARIEQLTEQRSMIDVEIDRLVRQIEEKEDVKEC